MGYALLAILPLSMAVVTLGGDKFPSLTLRSVNETRATPGEPSTLRAPVISLAPLEPVITADRDTPVFFPGYLLPADATEESSDGGH